MSTIPNNYSLSLGQLQRFEENVQSFIQFLEKALGQTLDDTERESARNSVRKSYEQVMMPVFHGN